MCKKLFILITWDRKHSARKTVVKALLELGHFGNLVKIFVEYICILSFNFLIKIQKFKIATMLFIFLVHIFNFLKIFMGILKKCIANIVIEII